MIKAINCIHLNHINIEDIKKFDVIGIDEGQFFDDLVEFSESCANEGKIVIISALNSDFKK